MGLIRLLPEKLISQIAAGEVVERPASVVKELVENSIDASSTNIIIEIGQGGTTLIKVGDNGIGMDTDDAKAMFQKHATSKISSLNDLNNIHSLGFRGEALAAISSVAKVTVKTKKKEALGGTMVTVDGGNLEKVEEIGWSEGTQIEVKNLFFNTPARKKFLKTIETEYSHILNTVTNLALAFQNIGFKLVHNERLIFDLPATSELLARLQLLLGKDYASALIPVFYNSKELQIEGFVGKPESSRTSKTGEYLFVNNREIKNAYLSHAITEAYHTLLPSGKYPLYLIKLQIDPTLVDVNVHPRKLEVRFSDQKMVYSTVKRAVASSLTKVSLTPLWQEIKKEILGKNEPSPKNSSFSFPKSSSPKFNFNPETYYPSKKQEIKQALKFTQELVANTQNFNLDRVSSRPKIAFNPLSQLAQSYILAEDEEGLVVIDQHAAHERIKYAALMTNLEQEEVLTQALLLPITLELSYAEVKILEENKELLEKLGFSIEAFSGNTFSILGVPACLSKEDIIEVLKGTLEDLQTEKPVKSVREKQEKVINYLACRSAVKFGRNLTKDEMMALIEQLETIDKKYTCPHGRPTMIKLTFNELEKKFGRT